MKANIHPNWYPDAQVVCACGNIFETGSTLPSIRVEICAKCHPLFTGQHKFIDTMGQIERFKQKTEIAKTKQEQIKKIRESKKSRVLEQKREKPSLKDLLMQARKQVVS